MTDAVFENGEYHFDPNTPWDDVDEIALETALTVADHFDDGHDPVACQLDNLRSTDHRRDHQTRDEWKLLREEAGLTQTQLAKLVGVAKENVSRYEANKRRPDNEYAYFTWLRARGDELGENARMKVWMLQTYRDGWWTTGEHWTLENRLAHWNLIFHEGGLFDRWRETGQLPVWKPSDSGHAA